MKNVKKLKSKSQEGLEVRNLQRFPSMEWGDEGGLQADLYYKGKYIMRVYNEGNGGCAICYVHVDSNEHNLPQEMPEFRQACYDFLLRNDEDFGPNSQYEFIRKIDSPDKLTDDEFEKVVIILEERDENAKHFTKHFKKGWKYCAVYHDNIYTHFVGCNINDVDRFKQLTKVTTDDIQFYTPNDLTSYLVF